MTTDLAGRNLSYVRTLLGMQPKYGDVNDAALATPTMEDGTPGLFSVCYYDDDGHGNIGLAVGDGYILTLFRGEPKLTSYDDATLGRYLGWAYYLGEDPVPR